MTEHHSEVPPNPHGRNFRFSKIWDLSAELIPLVTGLVGVIVAIFLVIRGPAVDRTLFSMINEARVQRTLNNQAQVIASLQARLDSLERELQVQWDSLIRNAADRTPEFALLTNQQTALDNRLNNVERVILSDPAKALDVVLIRRDLESVKEVNSANLAAIEQDVDRIYDLSKWIIGLMFTMSLGVFSLAAANVFKERRRDDAASGGKH